MNTARIPGQSTTPSSAIKPNYIPEDVLIQVLMILSQESYHKNNEPTGQSRDWARVWDWVCVTEVCWYWRKTATEASNLWSHIGTQSLCNAKRTRRFLLLSKNADLVVHYTGDGVQFSNLRLALKEMQRIRDLWIRISFEEEVVELLHLLNQSAPRVESICLQMSHTPTEPKLSLACTSPGTLRRVDLTMLNLSPNAMSCLSELTSLHLRYCYEFSLSELFEVVEKSPRLSSFSIVSCGTDPSSISRSVCLPYLTYLHLSFTDFSELYDVLCNLEAPNLSKWVVICDNTLPFTDVARLNIFSKLTRERDYNIFYMKISIFNALGASHISMETVNDSFLPNFGATLQLSFDEMDVDLAFRHLVDVFENHLARAESLGINDPKGLITVDNWCGVFRASISAKVMRVSISKSRGGMTSVKALSPNAEEGMPCPSAKHITFKWFGESTYSELDELFLVLGEVLSTRATYGCAVRKLTVVMTSDSYAAIYNGGRSDKLTHLSQMVEEMEWKSLR